ncbi:hypothetical protein [Tissierella sp.]|uniref:hypothetical protein n=1 Tax=Tissierella sp. TaxID=41274 RepID=UPI00285CC54B|nr:hypothetical protein [Tissierella sp.]MDR7856930.1 hypothetical protein [Tissierella sp.]
MKKVIFVILICTFVLVGCTTTDNSAEDNNTNYTKEFPFLPNHPDMKFVEILQQGKENEYSSATYIVKNATQEKVIEDYIDILESDSWNLTVDKPILINATKDDHQVNIYINPADNDVSLTIVAK